MRASATEKTWTPDPRFALPEPEKQPCEFCGRPDYGKLCEECREYARMFRFDGGAR